MKNAIQNALNLPPMGQLGIIVKNIPASLPFYTSLLNIRPWYRAHVVESEIYYMDRRIDLELDIAIGFSGPLQFELIQVVKGPENHCYSDLMKTRGEGLHHIGFVVSGIEKKMSTLENAGFGRIQHGSLKTKGRAITRFAYYDTLDACGYITELIQTTLFGINVGMSRFMVKIGRLVGDVAIV
jgi:catechol 2,3-dioxygenase-like lactoylglutathione lyase family enzyme